MMKYFSKRESNYFIRKYEVNGVMGFILMIWDERKLNFQMLVLVLVQMEL